MGGGGGNALNRMIEADLQHVDFWAINTDAQALAHHSAPNKLQIGTQVTRGLGCGGNPELGRHAAQESQEAIRKVGRRHGTHIAPCRVYRHERTSYIT